jgi:hypothetical protein
MMMMMMMSEKPNTIWYRSTHRGSKIYGFISPSECGKNS